jgi:hypothetical protein
MTKALSMARKLSAKKRLSLAKPGGFDDAQAIRLADVIVQKLEFCERQTSKLASLLPPNKGKSDVAAMARKIDVIMADLEALADQFNVE